MRVSEIKWSDLVLACLESSSEKDIVVLAICKFGELCGRRMFIYIE